MAKPEPVEVSVEIKAKTASAFLVSDGTVDVWIPFSLIDEESTLDQEAQVGETGDLLIRSPKTNPNKDIWHLVPASRMVVSFGTVGHSKPELPSPQAFFPVSRKGKVPAELAVPLTILTKGFISSTVLPQELILGTRNHCLFSQNRHEPSLAIARLSFRR